MLFIVKTWRWWSISGRDSLVQNTGKLYYCYNNRRRRRIVIIRQIIVRRRKRPFIKTPGGF